MLHFETDRKLTLAVAVILAFLGLTTLAMWWIGRAEGVPGFLGAAGVGLCLGSGFAATFSRKVTIDPDTGLVSQATGCLGWSDSKVWFANGFRSVGIGMATRSSQHGVTSASYFVQLLGPENVNLPGRVGNLDRCLERAREVARTLGLALDERPRTVFFKTRL